MNVNGCIYKLYFLVFVLIFGINGCSQLKSPIVPAEPTTSIDLLEKSPYPSVVGIQTTNKTDDKITRQWGSGFVINANEGYIVTAKHVVSESTNGICRMLINGEVVDGIVVWQHDTADVAVIKIVSVDDVKNIREILLGEKPRFGDHVITSGFQIGGRDKNFYHFSRTVKLRVDDFIFEEEKDGANFIVKEISTLTPENTLWFFKGLSGSPLIDSKGRVVGVSSNYTSEQVFFIPIDKIPEKYFGEKKR